MQWDTLLAEGKRKLRESAEANRGHAKAADNWMNLLAAATAVGQNALPVAQPPGGLPPAGFTYATDHWEVSYRTPVDRRVTIRVKFLRNDDHWEPVTQYGPAGMPGAFVVPWFYLAEANGATWVEESPRDQWLYAEDLPTACALAELSARNLAALAASEDFAAVRPEEVTAS